jgi:hydrogenase maturation protease
MRVLIAGFGNVLRQDDGFGVRLLQRLRRQAELPAGVVPLELGIGGIGLVLELMGGYDALVVLDSLGGEASGGGGAASYHDPPGTVKLLEAEVPEVEMLPRDFLADTHYAEPGRAMALAKAVGCLPPRVYLIGCVSGSEELGERLTAPVRAALDEAAGAVTDLLAGLLSEGMCDSLPGTVPVDFQA